MSLYNILFGRNAQSSLLLATVGLKENDVERFRDVYVDGSCIAIYTRTGGGNRDYYPNDKLTSSPLYVRGEDDDFDCTYRTFYLCIPEGFISDVANLSDPLKYGLRAKFANHLAKTLQREATEEDKATAAYQAEREALARTGHTMANGHTFVPFDDAALLVALKLAEANDGKLRSCWGIAPLRLDLKTNFRPWPNARSEEDRKRLTRFEVSAVWETDAGYWQHIQDAYGEDYPLTIARMRESAERYPKAAA